MMKTNEKSIEQHIIDVAKQMFVEKGFHETSMCAIAKAAGINRPGLHYYFRTKDRMFEAVFSDIIQPFIPAIHEIVQQDHPIMERTAMVLDVYFEAMTREPYLPTFLMREIHRDPLHLIDTVCKLETIDYIRKIREILLSEMVAGRIRQVPLETVFYTFYGLLFIPFLSKPLTDIMFAPHTTDYATRMKEWKAQVMKHITMLLMPEDAL